MRVLENDRNRDVFADEAGGGFVRDRGGDRHSGFQHESRLFRRVPVDVDASVLDEALPHRARRAWMPGRQERIEPHARGVVRDVEADAPGAHAGGAVRTRSRMRKNAPTATAARLNNWEVDTAPPNQRPRT